MIFSKWIPLLSIMNEIYVAFTDRIMASMKASGFLYYIAYNDVRGQ